MLLGRLKIAISGPNASGKTTLANAIADRYQLPVIAEGVAPVFSAQAILEKLRSDRAPVDEVVQARNAWINSFVQWEKCRETAYARHPGFVADRWEADLLDLWLVFMRNEKNVDPLTMQFAKNLAVRAKELDFVIMMPFVPPLADGKNDVDLPRANSFTNRLLNTMVTAGIIYSIPNLRILKIPPAATTVAERLQLVAQVISAMR